MGLPKCSYIEPSTTELGKCYSRLRDKIGHKPLPWTIPEVRAYWDEYDASIAWYDTDGHLIDVDVNALIEKQKDEALVLGAEAIARSLKPVSSKDGTFISRPNTHG